MISDFRQGFEVHTVQRRCSSRVVSRWVVSIALPSKRVAVQCISMLKWRVYRSELYYSDVAIVIAAMCLVVACRNILTLWL